MKAPILSRPQAEPAPKRLRKEAATSAQARRTRGQLAEQTWEEMQKQEAEEAKKWVRHPCSDLLFRTLQQPQPAKAKIPPAKNCLAVVAQIAKYGQVKDTDDNSLSIRELKKRSREDAGQTTSSVVRPQPRVSKSNILAEVVKFSNLSTGDAQPSTAEVKRKVRLSKEELTAQSPGSSGQPKLMRTVQVEESVKFAGETLTVTRQLLPGTAEEKQFLLSQKRRQSAKLGGKFAALDNLLGTDKDKVLNTVEKSDLDWQRHQQEAGLQDLSRDPQAGYIERSEFLRRANLRASEAIRDAARAAARKVQMAQAEVARVQKHRDRVLSEGRQEVGIWSSFGVQDVRRSFWNAWQSGKDFAAQCTFYNVLFAVGARDESLYIMIFRLVMQYVVNLTLGLIGAFCYFLYNMYLLIVSYGSSVLSGVAFFLLATVAGLSMLTTYLGGMYAVVAGGGAMIIQQAARHAALEMSKQDALQQIDDDKPVKKQAVQRDQCTWQPAAMLFAEDEYVERVFEVDVPEGITLPDVKDKLQLRLYGWPMGSSGAICWRGAWASVHLLLRAAATLPQRRVLELGA
ncbi:CFDP1, partial [Symbiodinium sp. KB8]